MRRSADELDVTAPLTGGALRSAVSQALVRLYATAYGKGATQVKTYTMDNVLVTLMRDVLTPAERTMIGAGRIADVQRFRAQFQEAMRPSFIAQIETLTGRRVESFLSQIDPAGDMISEIFVLDQPVNGGADAMNERTSSRSSGRPTVNAPTTRSPSE